MPVDGREENSHASPELSDPALRAAAERTEWYFGELIDRVTADHPVTRQQVIRALAEIDRSAQCQDPLIHKHSEPVDTTAPGQVLRLPPTVWEELSDAHELSGREAQAARAVYQEMATAILPHHAESEAPIVVVATDARQ